MQDALARYRVRMGQKVIALDLGILAKNERFRVVRTTKSWPTWQKFRKPSSHAILEYYCNLSLKICPRLNIQQMVRLLAPPAEFRSKGAQESELGPILNIPSRPPKSN